MVFPSRKGDLLILHRSRTQNATSFGLIISDLEAENIYVATIGLLMSPAIRFKS